MNERENMWAVWISWGVALILILIVGCGEESSARLTTGAMAGGDTVELRVGAQRGALEADIGPRFDTRSDAEDTISGLRSHAIWNAVDANMVTTLFGNEFSLPPGQLYAGLFGDWHFDSGDLGGGWLVGGRVNIGDTQRYHLDLAIEYNYVTMEVSGDTEKHVALAGPRLLFK